MLHVRGPSDSSIYIPYPDQGPRGSRHLTCHERQPPFNIDTHNTHNSSNKSCRLLRAPTLPSNNTVAAAILLFFLSLSLSPSPSLFLSLSVALFLCLSLSLSLSSPSLSLSFSFLFSLSPFPSNLQGILPLSRPASSFSLFTFFFFSYLPGLQISNKISTARTSLQRPLCVVCAAAVHTRAAADSRGGTREHVSCLEAKLQCYLLISATLEVLPNFNPAYSIQQHGRRVAWQGHKKKKRMVLLYEPHRFIANGKAETRMHSTTHSTQHTAKNAATHQRFSTYYTLRPDLRR